MAKILIDLGVDVTVECPASGNYGLAINSSDNVEMAEFLISNNMKPNLDFENDIYKNPIFYQLNRENFEMVKFWINYEIKYLNDNEKKRLLKLVFIISYEQGYEEILSYLKEEYNMSIEEKEIPEFHYELFRNKLEECVILTFNSILNDYKEFHIYSFSLACSNTFDSLYFLANTEEHYKEQDMEEQLYYKYDEEEWDIWITSNEFIDSLSSMLKEYLKNIRNGKERKKFSDKIEKIFINTMIKMRKDKIILWNILLNVYIREWSSDEDMIELYEELNGKDRATEYRKYLDE